MATQYEEEERQKRLDQATSIPPATPPPALAGVGTGDTMVGPEPGLYRPTATGFTPERNVMAGGPASATGDSPFWRTLKDTVNSITGVNPGVSPTGSAYANERRDASTTGTVGGAMTMPTDLGDQSRPLSWRDDYATRQKVGYMGTPMTTPPVQTPQSETQAPRYGRDRLLEMMGKSPEELDKYIEGMPGKYAPIEEIRGTDRTWWNPQTGDSYGTKAEAITGQALKMSEREKVNFMAEQARILKGMEETGRISAADAAAYARVMDSMISSKADIEKERMKQNKPTLEGLSNIVQEGGKFSKLPKNLPEYKDEAYKRQPSPQEKREAQQFFDRPKEEREADRKNNPKVYEKMRRIMESFYGTKE